MKSLTLFLIIFFYIESAAPANEKLHAVIPVTINHVEMDVIGQDIVRIIQYNMELNPILQVELMSRPNFQVVDSLTISELPYMGEVLSFKKSSGAFVEGTKFLGTGIDFEFEYFYLRGGSVLLSCLLPVKSGRFHALTCKEKAN
jgi:hypothetical protein